MFTKLPNNLSDHELHIEVEKKAGAEKTATLELLEYLHEIDLRRVYALMGYSSLWEYVCKYLKYSEYQASEKINAMRLMARVPEVKKCIAENKLNLTVTSKLATHVRREKLSAQETTLLLDQVMNKSVREVERVLVQNQKVSIPSREDQIKAVSSETSRISFDADKEFLELLNQVKNHQSDPTLSLQDVLKKTMKEYLLKREVKQHAFSLRSIKVSRVKKASSRYVSVDTKNAVRLRSENQCEYVDSNSKRKCEEKMGLQFDHILPKSRGGAEELENIRHLCKTHNLYEATKILGPDVMKPYLENVS